MKTTAALPALLVLLFVAGCVQQPSTEPAGIWQQYASPAEAGFSPAALEPAFEAASQAGSVSVMAVHRGRVLVAWGDVDRELELHSVRKSLYSAMAGIAVNRGLIDPQATLADLGIDDLQGLTPPERQATFADLIAARSGVYHPSAYSPRDMDEGLPARGSHPPGTHFYYNNWDFNVAAAVIEQQADLDLYQAFDRWIAEPLGMQDWSPSDGYRAYEPLMTQWPAPTFRMSTRDLARFGVLIAQGGRWGSRQIVPAEWVDRATSVISEYGNGCGYGYMWWIYANGCLSAEKYPAASKHRIILARGTGGQAVFVVPTLDLVVVHRGDTDRGRGVSGGPIWGMLETIIAAHQGTGTSEPQLVPLAPRPFPDRQPFTPPPLRSLPADEAADLMGRYEFAPGVHGQVFPFQGAAYIEVPGEGEAELFVMEDGRLTIRVEPGVRITVERDASGNVTGLLARLGDQEIPARKVD